ncbi:MAG: sensor histidine kinase [Phycisphaeraceae bacterium]|nr:sensor histidine kinase [Phycisphaeraceae bacterium]
MSIPPDPSSPQPPPPPGDRRSRGRKAGRAGKNDAPLRRTVVRPAGLAVDPIDSAFVTDRLTTLTHELANLLDGSMRCLTLAQRSVGRSAESGAAPTAQELTRHLDTVQAAMRQMSELVKCAMQGVPLSHAHASPDGAGGLAEAIRHAVEVMMPLADERGIRLSVEVPQELIDVAAGPVFAVVTNALRNSIEAIERTGRSDGAIDVTARAEPGRNDRSVILEITDDGEGPPELPIRGGESVFRLGYTTKPGGTGVGLAVSRELVQELGGTIQLIRREADPRTARTGALLRVTFPLPRRIDGPVL